MPARLTFVVGIAAALAVVACRSNRPLYEPHRVATMPEAGSVHFAVLSVAPWDEVKSDLAPDFKLTTEAALEESIARTQSMENSLLRLFGAQFGGKSTRDIDTPGAGAAASTASDGQELTSPPKPDDIKSPPSDRPKPDDFAFSKDVDAGVDPMAKYWSATALYQEVGLLSKYIEYAALRDGYEPYLVRIQITLMPKSRDEPYDAYTTISFFPDEGTPSASRDEEFRSRALDSLARNAVTPDVHGAIVLPLLVTDNLESSLQYRQRQSITQLAAAIQYFRTEVGTLGGVQFQDAALEQALGNDLNSLLSVARVSDNTLRVRLGAMQQGSARFAMVPRNHNVTVLVMVPSGATGCMKALTKTTLVDTLTGEELPDGTEQTNAAAFARLRARFELGENVGDDTLRQLLAHAQANAPQRFIALLDGAVKPEQPDIQYYWQALWVDLISLGLRSPYASTSFELPGMPPCGGKAGLEAGSDSSSAARRPVKAPTSFKEEAYVVGHATGSPPQSSWTIAVTPSADIDASAVTTRILALRGSQPIAHTDGSPFFDDATKQLVLSFAPIPDQWLEDDVVLRLELSIGGDEHSWIVTFPE